MTDKNAKVWSPLTESREDEYAQSDFNMSISTLNRINILLYSYNYMNDDEIEDRAQALKRIWAEVYPFEWKKGGARKIEPYNLLLTSIKKDVNEYKIRARSRGNGFTNAHFIVKNELLDNLDELDLMLRVALYEHDLLIKKSKDPGKSIIG